MLDPHPAAYDRPRSGCKPEGTKPPASTIDAMRLSRTLLWVLFTMSSGYSIIGQVASILERDCSGFTQKPFSLKQLSEKIGQILDDTCAIGDPG